LQYVFFGRHGVRVYPLGGVLSTAGLWSDFLDALETNRRPISAIEEIHRSTNLSLLGMLSYKLGRSVRWDQGKGRVRRKWASATRRPTPC